MSTASLSASAAARATDVADADVSSSSSSGPRAPSARIATDSRSSTAASAVARPSLAIEEISFANVRAGGSGSGSGGASDEDDDDPSALAARGRIHVGTAVDDGPRPRVLARHPARARRAVDAALGARRAPGVAETRAATARIVVRASSRRSTDEISARCDRLLSTPPGVRLGADLVSSRGD
jgi:hypothetical protein